MNKSLKTLAAFAAIIATSALLTACGEQKFTADQVQQISGDAAARAAGDAKATAAAQMDSKWIAARAALRQMGASAAATGKYLIVDNCNVKPDGFSQLQANKDFPSSAFTEFRAGCTDKVHTMKAERDRTRRDGMVAKQKHEQKLAKLKECGQKPTQKLRETCKADVRRHA